MLPGQHPFSQESFEISREAENTDKTTWSHVRKTEPRTSGGLYRNRFLPIKPDFIKRSDWGKAFSLAAVLLWGKSKAQKCSGIRTFLWLYMMLKFPIINIIWELLLLGEGEEITVPKMREISGLAGLDLPVLKNGTWAIQKCTTSLMTEQEFVPIKAPTLWN